jgi:two-component system, NarL family, sensor kinase
MQQNQEIYFVIIIGAILGLLLIGFIVSMLIFYKQRQHRQEQEMESIKDKYDKEVLRSQLEIQENTFKTISQELHDNIGQMLSVVKLSLSALPLEKDHPAHDLAVHSREVLNKAIFDLSHLTKSLHTDRIRDVGLVESMKFELTTIRNTGLLQTQFAVTGLETTLPEQKSIFLFRMFQEALNNILKHSRATDVSVGVEYMEDETFVLEVKDNGVGFDPDEVPVTNSGKGVGLKSMMNRAKMIGAEIRIESIKQKGTKVVIKLPPSNGYEHQN